MLSAGEAELVMLGQFDAIQLVGSTLMAGQGTGVVAPTGPRSAVAGASSAEQTGPGAVGDIASLSQREFYEKEARRLAAPVLAEALHFSSATLITLDQILRQLVALPGRKICLLVSDGFYLGRGTDQDRTRDMQRVIDAATRSGAVVYTLDARGLAGGEWREAGVRSVDAPPGLQQSVSSQTQQLLRENLAALADGTGGFPVRSTNDLESGLRRILADNDTYYLLAYEPTNTKRDGRFRKIEVRLAGHPTLAVRTRKGYYAPDDKNPDRTPAASSFYLLDESEARVALGAPAPSGGVPVQLATAYVDLPPVGPQALVGAHVDLDRLEWRKADKRERATVEIVGGVYDASGQPVGSAFGKRADLDLSPDEVKRARASGLEYQQSMPLPPGSYEVRLLARDAERRTLGGARERIDIPDLADKKLALSSVFLSSSSPTEAAREGRLPGRHGAAKRPDAAPLQAGRRALLPGVRVQPRRGREGGDRRRPPGPDAGERPAARRLEAAAGRVPGEGRRARAPDERHEPGRTAPGALRAARRGGGQEGQRDGLPRHRLHDRMSRSRRPSRLLPRRPRRARPLLAGLRPEEAAGARVPLGGGAHHRGRGGPRRGRTSGRRAHPGRLHGDGGRTPAGDLALRGLRPRARARATGRAPARGHECGRRERPATGVRHHRRRPAGSRPSCPRRRGARSGPSSTRWCARATRSSSGPPAATPGGPPGRARTSRTSARCSPGSTAATRSARPTTG